MLPNVKALDDLFFKLNKAMKVRRFCVVCLVIGDQRGDDGVHINVTESVLCLCRIELLPLYFHIVVVIETWT